MNFILFCAFPWHGIGTLQQSKIRIEVLGLFGHDSQYSEPSRKFYSFLLSVRVLILHLYRFCFVLSLFIGLNSLWHGRHQFIVAIILYSHKSYFRYSMHLIHCTQLKLFIAFSYYIGFSPPFCVLNKNPFTQSHGLIVV